MPKTSSSTRSRGGARTSSPPASARADGSKQRHQRAHKGGAPMTVTAEPATERMEGRVVAIAGPVIDVEFPPHALPEINNALEMDITLEGVTEMVTAEVAQQIGHGRVRATCLRPTDGLRRGTVVRNTGRGITVPVGDGTLGHVFNVIGQPLDITSEELVGVEDRWEIHRPSPPFDEL